MTLAMVAGNRWCFGAIRRIGEILTLCAWIKAYESLSESATIAGTNECAFGGQKSGLCLQSPVGKGLRCISRQQRRSGPV